MQQGLYKEVEDCKHQAYRGNRSQGSVLRGRRLSPAGTWYTARVHNHEAPWLSIFVFRKRDRSIEVSTGNLATGEEGEELALRPRSFIVLAQDGEASRTASSPPLRNLCG